MDPNAGRFAKLGELDIPSQAEPFEIVARNRERFLVPVRQPLIVLPQIQRSGGTLMTQLLDGHRQLHVHPSELHIGKPKYKWPSIDPRSPAATLFDALREENAHVHATSGYLKVSGAEAANNPSHRDYILPFVFLEALQRRLFVALMGQRPPVTQRDVLDHYATSYFNAWLDYAQLYRAPSSVKYWVAFVARLITHAENIERFFSDYPDGYMVVSVRDPVSWFASAVGHNARYADLDESLDLWQRSYTNALAGADRYPGRIVFVRFEHLVAGPRATLGALLRHFGLAFDDAVLEPTFNGMPIVSDSSFGARFGIDPSAIDRAAHVDDGIRRRIEAKTGDIFARLTERAADLLRAPA